MGRHLVAPPLITIATGFVSFRYMSPEGLMRRAKGEYSVLVQ